MQREFRHATGFPSEDVSDGHLVDDLECRAYSNTGPSVFGPLLRHGFVYAPRGSRPPGP